MNHDQPGFTRYDPRVFLHVRVRQLQVHGKCGSVRCRLIPAPRGSGIVGSPVMKRFDGRARRGEGVVQVDLQQIDFIYIYYIGNL